jgi:hypothetical protein
MQILGKVLLEVPAILLLCWFYYTDYGAIVGYYGAIVGYCGAVAERGLGSSPDSRMSSPKIRGD